MRILLSTLAVMAISATALTAAHAKEMDRDPEGSIEQSNTLANQQDMTSANDVSRMDPAAGVEVRRSDRIYSHTAYRNEPISKGDRSAAYQADAAQKYGDVENTVTPSRMTE